ncbi:caspase b-like [Chanodichthys erythropterus]|uniref:caspase b-like n=1 Tax=Chanodichthys erythropterus TaxID=933992 RepID=UPI00351E7BA0
MATTKTILLDVLNDLLEKELKEFKWHLWNGDNPIPRGKLEKADYSDVVDLMVQHYGTSDAGKIAVRVLQSIKQNELAKQLKGKLQEVQQPDQLDGRNAPVSVRQLQPIDSNWKRRDRITPCTQEFKEKILRENRDDVYIPNDKSQRKRVALLITNIKFKYLSYRHGAERDEDNMEWLLEALGYSVEKHTDLSGKEIEAEVKKFATLPDHNSDSTFVVIMSHGERINHRDAIAGVNYHPKNNTSDVFYVDDIFKHLNSKNCPALIDKPKVILIQACRGGHPGGVKMSDSALDLEAEDSALDSDTWVHKEKDFTCFMSTLPDITAYRHPDLRSGSFFVMYIVEVFCEWAQDTHIMELFRKVTSGMEKHPGREENKLLPCFERTPHTKNFYLFPGL